jgi:uncharacterized protein
MYVEVGPAGIVVTGEKDGISFDFDEEEIEKHCVHILQDVGDYLRVLRQKGEKIRNPSHMPSVARKMVEAVNAIDGHSLTPMAAVAGAVADGLKELLKEKGLDFVSVNNGGDISLFNPSGRKVRIGMGDIGRGTASPYVMEIKEITEYGIATSGFGGRSFTRGIADMVTVLAPTAAFADAAATSICNATNVETERVIRRKAGEIDPSSDIADEWVTVKVGALDDVHIKKALENGLAWARSLKDRRLILDAAIVLKGHLAATSGGDKNIYMEANHGNKEAGHDRGGYIC